jgi:hypothetical protein
VKGDRDAAIEHLLRRSPTTRADMPAEGCPDAETLAAWMDGALAGAALDSLETHIAECARCQATVAIVQGSTPDVPAPRPWWARPWTVGWLVPVTAGIAAVGIWVAVPRDRAQVPTTQTMTATAEPAEEQRSSPPAESGRLQERPQSRDEQAPAQPRPLGATNEERARANAPQQQRQLAERADAAPPQANDARASAKSADAGAPLTSPVSPPAAAPVSAPAASAAAPAAELSSVGRRESARGFAPEPTVVIASSARHRWRIVSGAVIQSTTDAGATWQNVDVGVPATLRAGSSPSATVCWMVGQGGLILRTTDGRTWQRVPFTESSDLIQVQANDGRTAQVTTADGRIFRTIDGGVTWAPVPLQEF